MCHSNVTGIDRIPRYLGANLFTFFWLSILIHIDVKRRTTKMGSDKVFGGSVLPEVTTLTYKSHALTSSHHLSQHLGNTSTCKKAC